MQKRLLWSIKTQRLQIYQGSNDDLQAVLKLLKDDELVRLSGLQLPNDQMIRSWAVSNWLSQKQLLLINDQNNQLIGLIGLFSIYADDGQLCSKMAALGYLLKKSCWGNEIMTEALANVLPSLAKNSEFNLLHADVASENIRSQSLLKKLGFDQVGNENGYLKMVKAL